MLFLFKINYKKAVFKTAFLIKPIWKFKTVTLEINSRQALNLFQGLNFCFLLAKFFMFDFYNKVFI